MKHVALVIGAVFANVFFCCAAFPAPVPAEEPPLFHCEFVGLTKDGGSAKVKLYEPKGRRVKSLYGQFSYHDKAGNTLQLPTYHDLGRYPFDRGPEILENVRITEGEKGKAFRKLATESPGHVVIAFQPTTVEYDDAMSCVSRRVSVTESPKGTVIEYEVEAGDVVFTARLKRRWERNWLDPKAGLVFSEGTKATGLRFSVRVGTPEATGDGQWKLEQGSVDSESWSGSFGSAPVEEGEKRLPIRDTEIPVSIDGLEMHIVPYRTVGERTDCLLIVFARDKDTMIKHMRVLPQEHGLDWRNRFFPARRPRSGSREAMDTDGTQASADEVPKTAPEK